MKSPNPPFKIRRTLQSLDEYQRAYVLPEGADKKRMMDRAKQQHDKSLQYTVVRVGEMHGVPAWFLEDGTYVHIHANCFEIVEATFVPGEFDKTPQIVAFASGGYSKLAEERELEEELQRGAELAIKLIDHLEAMGGASSTILPVDDRAEAYVVIVMPKAEFIKGAWPINEEGRTHIKSL